MKTETTGEITRKIGTNRGKRRLWIEGVCLASFGWKKGDRFNAKFEKGSVIYERDENGERAVAGDDKRPIIDTNTDKIAESLGAEAEQVRIRVTALKIVVKVAALALAFASLFFNFIPANAQRVLVACEFSGIVRDEFKQLGNDSISCDFLPTEKPGDHITGDVLEVLSRGCWDMVLAFPPCTFLCSSQLWRCNEKHDPSGERKAKQEQALQFVQSIMDCGAPKIALENPVGCISSRIRKPNQIIQPYQFGHDVSKKTCLWLKGLPKLKLDPAQYIAPKLIQYKGKTVERWGNQSPCGADSRGPSADRGHERSRTYSGIARAMAQAWGKTAKTSKLTRMLFNFAA